MADILIVDDEPQVREVLNRFAVAAGYATRQAADAQEAVAAMAAAPAGVVLCDVQMPGEHDGVWLTNDLRRNYHATAVVLITSDRTVPPATSLKAGVVAYIVKPFSRDAVLQAIGQAQDWHKSALAAGPGSETADALTAWLEEID